MIILLPNKNCSLVNPKMKLLLIAAVFGLFEAHHKGRHRGHDDDNDDDGEDKQKGQ